MMKNYALLFILGLFSLVSCRKDSGFYETEVIEKAPQVLIKSSFDGKVVSEDGTAIEGAIVEIGEETTTTDRNGLFHFGEISVPKNGATFRVKGNNDFFDGITKIRSRAGEKSYLKMTLMEKGTPKILSAAGGEVSFQEGGIIAIEEGSLITNNNDSYTEEVFVYARWIDPTTNNFGAVIPGSLEGQGAEEESIAMSTFGILLLELKGSNGERLRLAEAKTAKITMPISANILSEAPVEGDLAWYDLEQETWVIEGDCKLENGTYEATINNTGIWNCMLAQKAICLSALVLDSENEPAAYMKVVVANTSNNFVYWGYTNEAGYFCGAVPSGEILNIQVEDYCGNVLYSDQIGSFNTDTNLPDLTLNETVEEFVITVSGKLLDCNNVGSVLGQVGVRYPGGHQVFPVNGNGEFSFEMIFVCAEFPKFYLTGYDLTNKQQTAELLYENNADFDVGTLQTCNALEDYLNYTLEGNNFSLFPAKYSFLPNTTSNWLVIEAFNIGGNAILNNRSHNGIGDYGANISFSINNTTLTPDYVNVNGVSPNVILTITADDGEFIEGTLEGTVQNSGGLVFNMTGGFRVRKAL